MKRFAYLLCALAGVLAVAGNAQASGRLTYGGYQPWWNIFAKRPCLTAEEERLQRFWHDYYDALKRYYASLDRIDWVSYYKNHGYQINGNGGCNPCGPQRIQYAPVMVSPRLDWAVPNSCLSGPPAGAPCGPMGCGPIGMGPMGPGGPMMAGPFMGQLPPQAMMMPNMGMPNMGMPNMAGPQGMGGFPGFQPTPVGFNVPLQQPQGLPQGH